MAPAPQRIAGTVAEHHSLALLAHGARTPAPAFNSTFYATAATIIPVLFLAIAVQGHMYENLMKAASDAIETGYRQARLWRRSPSSVRTRQVIGPFLTPYLAIGVAVVILIFGVSGEILALTSLYLQRPADGSPQSVLTAAAILTVATAAVPALAIIRFFRRAYQADKAFGSTAPAESPAESAEPEPRKTGPAS
jgi:hypothetical protein